MNHILLVKFLTMIGISALVVWPNVCAAQESPALPSLRPEDPELFPVNVNTEKTIPLPNLWDGVDDNNDLHVLVGGSSVLNDVGQMVGTPFPPSPNFADMDNDGLQDLVVGDSCGFLWIYMNSGKKGEPKFTTGTFLHTFVGWASRVHVADWDQDGDYDIVIGNFFGDIVIMENTGTRQQYSFVRKMGIPRYVDPRYGVDDPKIRLLQVRLGKSPMILGVNVAPWVSDWNGDQKPDLIFGEGTYSANSVRLALNKGSRGKPAFVEENVFFLAYGEGFEQLTPCAVDYNGDGLEDLIVGTRTGQIRLYKGNKRVIEGKDLVAALRSSLAPAVLEFDGFLKIGDKPVWDTMTLVHSCDWNEDGLFDLLLGSTKGKIYIALNKGTKTNPSFPAATTIKGTNVDKDLLGPAGWGTSIGSWELIQFRHIDGLCNSALLLSAEREVILQPGALPIKPVAGDWFIYFRYIKDYLGWTQRDNQYVTGGRAIWVNGYIFKMVIGERYKFSFDSILKGKPVTWRLHAQELVTPGTDTTPPVYAYRAISDTVLPSGSWQKRQYQFRCEGAHKTNTLNYSLAFYMPEGDCTFMLDNFSLKQEQR